MARQANRILWDQWRQRIKRQRASGLSVAEFCRSENLSPHSFHVWKRKLQAAAAPRQASSSFTAARRLAERRSVATASRQMRRAKVVSAARPLPPEFLQLPIAAAQGSPWIELALADGTILRLPQQNLAALIAVLRVLRGKRLELPQGEGRYA